MLWCHFSCRFNFLHLCCHDWKDLKIYKSVAPMINLATAEGELEVKLRSWLLKKIVLKSPVFNYFDILKNRLSWNLKFCSSNFSNFKDSLIKVAHSEVLNRFYPQIYYFRVKFSLKSFRIIISHTIPSPNSFNKVNFIIKICYRSMYQNASHEVIKCISLYTICWCH